MTAPVDYWSLLCSHPNAEARVLENAERQGYEVYSPQAEVWRTGRLRVERMFPRYVFWRFVDAWASLRHTFGVSYILMNNQKPSRVPAGVVDDLRARENSRGLVELDSSRFTHGDKVKIERGPLTYQVGVFDRMSGPARACVLLDMLGGRYPVGVDEADLSVA